MAQDRFAFYKGKRYRLEFLGPTAYGRRAKLAFLDGSKSFWVDAALVTEATGQDGGDARAARRRNGGRCVECGGPVEDAPHHRAMEGYCGSCAFDEYDI
jgi:hypothetical protein